MQEKIQNFYDIVIPDIPCVATGFFLVLIHKATILNELAEGLIFSVTLVLGAAGLKDPGLGFSLLFQFFRQCKGVIAASGNDVQIVFTPNGNAAVVAIPFRKRA